MSRRNGDNQWWALELARLRPDLVSHLRRRGLYSSAEEVADAVSLELTEIFDRSGEEYPRSWFDGQPSSREESAFHGFVWRVVKLRALDELRRHYVRVSATRRLPAPQGAVSSDESRVQARRALSLLAKRLDGMSGEDRALLTGVLSDSDEPLPARERTRLHRLRKQLASELRQELEP